MSKKNSGLTRKELIQTGNVIEGKNLTSCLEDLEQCGFIRKYKDYTTEINGAHFQLIDPLCLFFFSFLDNGKIESWNDFFDTPTYYNWCGLAFEKVCLQHTKQIKYALGIAGLSSSEYSWYSKKTKPGVQIDLLIDRKDDIINVCEEKYSKEPFTIDTSYETDLIHKIEVFRKETNTKKALWLTMISFSGIKMNSHSNIVINSITGDDLFVL
ncbi:hypothetical protein SAMN02910369_02883 [Lachnospiraceae bacterium NE2001]|nr:hypothetical protein SAMN02910369_02883 [Lachnospiraceae bacterium NE2001]